MRLVSAIFMLFFFLFVEAQFFTIEYEDFSDCEDLEWRFVSDIDDEDVDNQWKCADSILQFVGLAGGDDIDWVISPPIRINNRSDVYLSLHYLNEFEGQKIEVFYSENFGGEYTPEFVERADWMLLDLDLISFFDYEGLRNPLASRSVRIASEQSNIFIGIKYESNARESTFWQVDDVRINSGYYDEIRAAIDVGWNCLELKKVIHSTIRGHQTILYSGQEFDVWDAFFSTDRRLNDDRTAFIVWDMSSDNPNGPEAYEYNHESHRDFGAGTGQEGEFYNRDHVIPRSWWGGGVEEQDTQYFDLHHLVPSDKLVNSLKSNLPLGEVEIPDVETSNGSRTGQNSTTGYSGQVYEPIDEYKGDFARMYFYMATRYMYKMADWETLNSRGDFALNGSEFRTYENWLVEILLRWHQEDPVSRKEIDRNNAIYTIQRNRNPYIDLPELVSLIWGDHSGIACNEITSIEDVSGRKALLIRPNPSYGLFYIQQEELSEETPKLCRVISAQGRVLYEERVFRTNLFLELDLLPGAYFISLEFESGQEVVEKLFIH